MTCGCSTDYGPYQVGGNNDTIAGNIAVGDEYPDQKKLQQAIKIANIGEFIEDLPFGYIPG